MCGNNAVTYSVYPTLIFCDTPLFLFSLSCDESLLAMAITTDCTKTDDDSHFITFMFKSPVC